MPNSPPWRATPNNIWIFLALLILSRTILQSWGSLIKTAPYTKSSDD
jgi:hypothetical protein